MTPEAIEELRRLERAATPGPWWMDDQTGSWRTDGVPDTPVCFVAEIDTNPANEQLLLAMRNALPALLEELTNERARVARLQEQGDATKAMLNMSESMRKDAVLRLEACAEFHQKAEAALESERTIRRELEERLGKAARELDEYRHALDKELGHV